MGGLWLTLLIAAFVSGAADGAHRQGIGAALGPSAATRPRSEILVVGSVNVDVTVEVHRLPHRHETLIARQPFVSTSAGGKGANQAVAAARLLAGPPRSVAFLGNFGNDAHAQMLRDTLEASGVATGGSGESSSHPSGQGLVLREADGSVSSVVAGGSNVAWGEEAVASMLRQAGACRLLMLQREVPEAINVAAAAAAKRGNATVILDCGGEDTEISSQLLESADFVCPNEGELGRLTGMATETDSGVLEAAKALQARGARNVLVTLGDRGSVLLLRNGTVLRQAAVPVPGGQVVDSTGAGDSYRAGFAVSLLEGNALQTSMAFAAAAGAVAVSREGAVPSLPHRAEVEALLGWATSTTTPSAGQCLSGLDACSAGFPLKFASRLNSMKARLDLWNGTTSLADMIARQGQVAGLDAVFLNYPQHLKGQDSALVKGALASAGLKAGAVCMRFPESMGLGALTNPQQDVREQAIRLSIEACKWADDLGADELIVWPQTDGYDYHMQVDYNTVWDRAVDGYRRICDACPGLNVSIEFKPTDATTRFSVVPSTAAALQLVADIGRENMKLTLDVGHLLFAGENPAQSIAMAARVGKLQGMQFGDGHSRLGAEDGLMFGSVHSSMALETALWLQRVDYAGYIYFDTFPSNEDPVREATHNIRVFKKLWAQAKALEQAGVAHYMQTHDAMSLQELLEKWE